MFFYLNQALKDFKNNKFLYSVTVVTICLSVLIISSLVLFVENANSIITSFKEEIRIIAYLEKDISEESKDEARKEIGKIKGVSDVVFISSSKALEIIKAQMKNQSSYLNDLRENLLPASFEVYLKKNSHNWNVIKEVALKIESLKVIEEVEYGKSWLGKFSNIISLFEFASIGMGLVFFLVTIFIIINTIRLSLYSRRKEIEIMRLVGAEDRFIKRPFYFEGVIQGFLGGAAGLLALFILFLIFNTNFETDFTSSGLINIKFLSFKVIVEILFCSIFAGWLGCYISVRQFLKN
jgi:cell division transport system permease protein